MGKPHRTAREWPQVFSHFHLIEPLPASPVLDSAEMEEALVAEALRRGQSYLFLPRILQQWRAYRRRSFPRPSFSLLNIRDVPEVDFARPADMDLIRRCAGEYDRMLRQEFVSLPRDISGSFALDGRDPFAYYCLLRPAFYRAGYSDPCNDIFRRIERADLLGHNVIGGLHQAFKERVAGLEKELNGWVPGLAARVSADIHRVEGFVPRNIGGSVSLSNHAFGLAIDIDAPLNPQIKEPDVILALKEITGYDFGQRFVPDDGTAEMDRVAQIHLLMGEASDRLRDWLRRYLPIYESSRPESAVARRPRSSRTPVPGVDDASQAALACEEPDLESALQMTRMRVLLKHHQLAELKQWSIHGIETIPIELAAAMAKLGFRWGAGYKRSKDIMHFELNAAEVLKPDSPPRPLDDLMAPGNEFALRMWLQDRQRAASSAKRQAAEGTHAGG